MGLSDPELVERAKRGDTAAFGELWARYESRVIAVCRRHLAGSHRDPAVDEHDLATDTFVRALHYLDRYEERSPDDHGFEAWLLAIARRVSLTFLEKQRRRQQLCPVVSVEDEEVAAQPDHAPTPEQIVEERQILRRAALLIHALPERYRIPFKLFLEEHSHRSIAEALGISVESAAKRVQRGRGLLQPRLADLFAVAAISPGTRKGYPPEVGQGHRRGRYADPGQRGGPATSASGASLEAVVQALTEIVSDYRIVAITLPGGGEMQLCLRVDRRVALSAGEIEGRRARLRRQPRAWKKRLELAELCYHTGHWEEAQQEYRSVLALQPGCWAAALQLGAMLRQERKAQEAAEIYRAALGQQPPPVPAAQLRAQLLSVEGRDEEAVDAFHRAIALTPDEKTNYYGLHFVLGRLSRYEAQLANLAKLRELDPEDLFALVEVYTPCARLGRFDLARPLLERAVALDPNSPMAVKHLFQTRMNMGLRDVETLALAERLVRLAPQFVDSWSELAWIYAELGREDESLAVLGKFLQEHPNNAEAHAALAWRYHYLDRPEAQAAAARRAYALEPQNSHVCWTLLTACQGASSPVTEAEAVHYAEEIAARFPRDAAILRWVSGVYCRWLRQPEALECARRAVALSPMSSEIRTNLALVYAWFHHWEAAAQQYEELMQQGVSRTCDILSAWGRALHALNDPRAEELLAEAAGVARSERDYLLLGQAFAACGKREAAIAALRRCLSSSSPDALSRRRAEAALRQLGR